MLSRDQKIKMHQELLDKIHQLYIDKNHDYGDSVHKTFEKYGMTSYLVRVEDKINRVYTLTKEGFQSINDEKIEDSLLDAANYLILAAIELEDDKSERVSCSTISYKNPVSIGMDEIISTDVTCKTDVPTTYTEGTLSHITVQDGKVTSYGKEDIKYKNEGGIHIYGHRSNSHKTHRKNS